jgi:hypothetical protein
VNTAELRRAVKKVDPEARISKVDDGHWTIRSWDKDAIERVVPLLGLAIDPLFTDHEGSEHEWIYVLHVFEKAVSTRQTKKRPAQLDTEIAEVLTRAKA